MQLIHHHILLIGIAVLSASCAKQVSEAPEPVKETPKKAKITAKPRASQASVVEATNLFRTPTDDLALPTDEQIAEGEQAAGIQPPAQPDPSTPSISIKPPANSPATGNP
ncbi:MAG: hypothetical protein ACPIA7_02595 [Akkermansiaceae bacterium]